MVRSGNRGSVNTRPRQLHLPSSGMSSDVQAALTRLQTKLQAIPPAEREDRERRFQALDRAMRRGRH
jgi:hypothetical protein